MEEDRMRAGREWALVPVLALVAGIGGCGGSGGSGTATPSKASGAKVIDVAALDRPATGTVRWCAAKDISGAFHSALAGFNAKFASQGLKAQLIEFPTSADEQRAQFIQRQQAKSADCDVFGSDVVWTAEFAAQKWLYDMTPYVQRRKDEFIASTFETTRYQGRNWGVPFGTNTAFLYYRTDQVPDVPASWQEVYALAKAKHGIVYQGAAYEGLTCDFLELAFAAGGKVLSDDGKRAEIDSPQNLKALQLMVGGLKDGAAKRSVTTDMEEEARQAFEAGGATFERNWSYAYGLGQKARRIKGKFAVAPLPPFEGGGRAGILGGVNLVVSAYSKRPGASLKLIDYLTSTQVQSDLAVQQPPTVRAAYDDPAVKAALPYSAELEQGVEQARARPVSPVYPQISQAIYKNVHAALAGQASPEGALKTAQAQIERALASF
jgi:multiple sugar transport system substrate-binding protein